MRARALVHARELRGRVPVCRRVVVQLYLRGATIVHGRHSPAHEEPLLVSPATHSRAVNLKSATKQSDTLPSVPQQQATPEDASQITHGN